MKRVIIVGAGIGGIATANILAKAGYRVTVYEKNTQAGGRAGLLKKDGFTFDTGPSWYLMPEVFRRHFALFGKAVDDELDLVRLDPAYNVFYEDHSHVTITGNLDTDAATFEAIEPGAGQQLRRYVAKSEAIYQLALRHFLYSNFTAKRDLLQTDILKNSLSMLRLAMQPIDSYVRSFVQHQKLRQILEYPMVFLGTSPFEAPALYSLMSALDLQEGVFYPRGGMYTIIERLLAISAELGVEYRYNTEIRSFEVAGDCVTGVKLATGIVEKADIVISNADLHFTETQLVPADKRTYPAAYWQRKQAGPSALLCYLGVKGELPQLEHHNLFFTEDWQRNFDAIFQTKTVPQPASLYVCKPSQTDATVAPAGHENVFVLVPLPAGISQDSEAYEAYVETYLRQIAEWAQIPDFTERIMSKTIFTPQDFTEQFHAWQGTALGPSHILSQSALFRMANKSQKLDNLYYVGGTTTPGIGLPMCLISAELVYKRLIGDKRGGPLMQIAKKEEDNA